MEDNKCLMYEFLYKLLTINHICKHQMPKLELDGGLSHLGVVMEAGFWVRKSPLKELGDWLVIF
jgi:hypothetical protein